MKLNNLYTFIFCFFVAASITASAQNVHHPIPDSLQQIIDKHKNDDDFAKIKSLCYVSDVLIDLREYSMLLPLANEIISLSDKNTYPYGNIIGNYYLSAHYLNIDNYSKSIEHLTAAYSNISELENNEEKSILRLRIHLALSVYYHRMSMLPQALDHINQAMEINSRLNILKYEVSSKNNFGGIYADIDNPAKGIEIVMPLLDIKELTKQQKFLINMNIGVLYSRQNMIDSAFVFFDRARQYASTDKDEMAVLYMIGNIYLQIGDVDNALHFLLQSISVDNALNNPDAYALSVIRIASIYSHKEQYDIALYYVNEGINQLSALSLKCNGLAIKSDILKNLEKFEESTDVLSEYIALNDSLNNMKNVSKTSQMIFDYEKKQELMRMEIDNYILQAKYNKQKNSFIILIITLLMGIIIVLLLLNRKNIILRSKKESEAALKDQLELKNKELATKVILQLQKNEVIEEIINIISEIEKSDDNKHSLRPIIKKLKHLKVNSSWSDFDYGFIKVHQHFYDKLAKEFPDLSLTERRLCALIKLNLNTKEIASISNLSPDSVRVARTRLRKKLNLTHSDIPLVMFFADY